MPPLFQIFEQRKVPATMRMLLSGVAIVSVALVWCPALVLSNMSQLMQVSPTYSLRSFQIFGGSADNPGYMTPERFNNLTLMERQVAGLVGSPGLDRLIA